MEKEFKSEAAVALLGIISEFPGLVDDSKEVNGADLVEFVSFVISNMSPESKRFAAICTDVMGEF